jgi:uncharacterized protein YyaL (SSP411 family)
MLFISRLRSKRAVPRTSALREMMAWLVRAHDATPDDGVAQAYFVKTERWAASYPETTGYIIPTFFDYAHLAGDPGYSERAIRMTRWASAIQLEGGAIQASTIDAEKVVPTVFNTGMVIFGWVRAYQETGESRFLESARRAARWLTDVQDADGAWRKHGSTVTAYSLNTYNTRVAWSLLEAHRVTEDDGFRRAAIRNLDWALGQQIPNGWLENNCLSDNEQPYTHTIAYAMRGFLESAHYLGDHRYLVAAERIFDGLRPRLRGSGYLPARFDRRWKPTARYCCLTGNSQLALNGFRLYQLTGRQHYLDDSKRLLRYVLGTQDRETANPHIRGGIAGSEPLQGRYHPYQYPNWAAKFTADALMQWMEIEPQAEVDG